MIQYCSGKKIATLEYKFGNAQPKIERFSSLPIDVEVTQEPPPFTGGQCSRMQYTVNVQYSYRHYQGISTYTTGWDDCFGKITGLVNTSTNPDSLDIYLRCHSYTGIQYDRFVLYMGNKEHLIFCKIVYLAPTVRGEIDNCGDPPGKCSLQVKHSEILLLNDFGECPCSYSVNCMNCPPNYLECNGYCLPCSNLKSEIQAIRAMAISKKRS